ncbi:hypothetical protein M427DRAFT_51714 [Gonapodya prolifera JEL478]|uniref:Uncharacterized protein n=1 Tax=Gonapodya prolifera (strain JEL478) TaxID=1344416 RepID=A0A139AVI1_GONPJ|nr:hypothetical protein M427DRAFT_51714 [Gonapodya prolifera JEL478]|eukprot:KXS20738.1 hypothetical protein M427DRAFT_51714 [Gonapodya prolifera JEL478]
MQKLFSKIRGALHDGGNQGKSKMPVDGLQTDIEHLVMNVFIGGGGGKENVEAIQDVLKTVGTEKAAFRRLIDVTVTFLTPHVPTASMGNELPSEDSGSHKYRQQALSCIRVLDAFFTTSPNAAREIASSSTFWKAAKAVLRSKIERTMDGSSGDVVSERLVAVIRGWMRSADEESTRMAMQRKESGLVMDRLVEPEKVVIFSPNSRSSSKDAETSSIPSRASQSTAPTTSFIVPLNSVRSGVMELKLSMLVSEVDDVVRQADTAMRSQVHKGKADDLGSSAGAGGQLAFRAEESSSSTDGEVLSADDTRIAMQACLERAKDVSLKCSAMTDEMNGNAAMWDFQIALSNAIEDLNTAMNRLRSRLGERLDFPTSTSMSTLFVPDSAESTDKGKKGKLSRISSYSSASTAVASSFHVSIDSGPSLSYAGASGASSSSTFNNGSSSSASGASSSSTFNNGSSSGASGASTSSTFKNGSSSSSS